jgi:hypothetical protein
MKVARVAVHCVKREREREREKRRDERGGEEREEREERRERREAIQDGPVQCSPAAHVFEEECYSLPTWREIRDGDCKKRW